MTTRILLDCDPGTDDAIAIATIFGDPDLDLVGLTAVSGNAPINNTYANAKALRDYFGVDVPVWRGADAPLNRPAVHAPRFHGVDGLGGLTLAPAPGFTATPDPVDEDAADGIIRLLAASPGEIHVVAVGPLTNIAIALQREPRVAEWAASFTIMGGSSARGNTTPAAEFNIYADPEAASIAFQAGWTVVVAGLDVTEHIRGTNARLAALLGAGEFGSSFLRPLLTHNAQPSDDPAEGPTMHDAYAVATLTRPELFESLPARVDVELTGTYTLGMTVTNFRATEHNARIVTRGDADAVWAYLSDSILAANVAREAHTS